MRMPSQKLMVTSTIVRIRSSVVYSAGVRPRRSTCGRLGDSVCCRARLSSGACKRLRPHVKRTKSERLPQELRCFHTSDGDERTRQVPTRPQRNAEELETTNATLCTATGDVHCELVRQVRPRFLPVSCWPFGQSTKRRKCGEKRSSLTIDVAPSWYTLSRSTRSSQRNLTLQSGRLCCRS